MLYSIENNLENYKTGGRSEINHQQSAAIGNTQQSMEPKPNQNNDINKYLKVYIENMLKIEEPNCSKMLYHKLLTF